MAPVAKFDSIAPYYDASRGGPDRGRRFAKVIAELLIPGGGTLEIGVGTGLVAAGLRELGRPVHGIDISAGMLQHAVQRLPGGVAQADATRLPLRSACLANCYAVWVLHMVPDLAAAVAEVDRVLQPGGRFLACSANNVASPDAIGAIVHTMRVRLTGGPEAGNSHDTGGANDPDDAVDAADPVLVAGLAQGFHAVPGNYEVRQSFLAAPASMAANIERRGFSSLVDVTDEQWESVVLPAIRALRDLPDPETPVERQTVHRFVVLEKA